jgi:hypothetical protein
MKKIVLIAFSLPLVLATMLPLAAQESSGFSSRKVFKGSVPGIGL